MSQPNPLCVGIDVSKATLDIAASCDIAQFTVSNDSDGFEAIIVELSRHPVVLVLMEATGGLEAAVACSPQAEERKAEQHKGMRQIGLLQTDPPRWPQEIKTSFERHLFGVLYNLNK